LEKQFGAVEKQKARFPPEEIFSLEAGFFLLKFKDF